MARSLFDTDGAVRPLVSGDQYFPSGREEFELLFRGRAGGKRLRPSALLIPHGGAEFTAESVSALSAVVDWSGFEGSIIAAPVHREPERTLFLPPYRAFATPFGELPAAEELIVELCARIPAAESCAFPFQEEPAFDLICTLLAAAGERIRILPVLAGDEADEVTEGLARIIEDLSSRRWLPILSVNLRRSELSGDPDFRCGGELFALFTRLFQSGILEWYDGGRHGYASAAWFEPGSAGGDHG